MPPDSWINGLFDTTNLERTTAYNPSAIHYDTLAIVEDYYNSDNCTAPIWFYATLADVFIYHSDGNTQVEHTGLDTGAIAGGVVGGVADLTVIAVTAFYLFRARKRQPPKKITKHPMLRSS